MSLDSKALALATAVGEDIKNLLTAVGDLTDLTTVDKTSLVNAVNELQTSLQEVQDLEVANNATIDDLAGAGTLNKGWSADKIINALEAAKDEVLNGAPEALNTLKEIADYIAANDSEINDLLNLLTGTVRHDASQSLTGEQQLQACTNIDVGNNELNVREIYLIASDTNTYIEPGYVEPGYYA